MNSASAPLIAPEEGAHTAQVRPGRTSHPGRSHDRHRAILMTASGHFVAVTGQFLVAADTGRSTFAVSVWRLVGEAGLRILGIVDAMPSGAGITSTIHRQTLQRGSPRVASALLGRSGRVGHPGLRGWFVASLQIGRSWCVLRSALPPGRAGSVLMGCPADPFVGKLQAPSEQPR